MVIERHVVVEAVAEAMGMTVGRVRQLVEEEVDRREMAGFRCESIPVQRTQAVIAEALDSDPDLTIAEIARWLDMQQADFERAFLGRQRGDRAKRRVTVTNASRLMIALGRAPNELDGC